MTMATPTQRPGAAARRHHARRRLPRRRTTSASRRSRGRTPGPGEAVIRVTLTTICGTDLHIVRGEYPVKPGLIIGHEPVGVIEELGAGVTGYEVGDRVLVGAITPCGQCRACLSGKLSQCGHGNGYEAIGGWRFGNTINGAQAEYLLVPERAGQPRQDPRDADRRAGRAARRHRLDRLRRRRVGQGAHRRRGGRLRPGTDRPVRDRRREAHGRGAASSASTATTPCGDGARGWAPTSCSTTATVDVVAEVKRLTGGAAPTWPSRRSARRRRSRTRCAAFAPAARVSSLGVYSGKLQVPYEAFAAGLGDHTIVTTLCPGGKERMRRLMRDGAKRAASIRRRSSRTASRSSEIGEAYRLFGDRRDGVLKVAIRP